MYILRREGKENTFDNYNTSQKFDTLLDKMDKIGCK